MYARKIKITKSISHKIPRLKSCLDMCCMPYAVHDGNIYIRQGENTKQQVDTEIKRVLGV
ncbi:MAG: hypothetical protein ACI4YB_03190 [Oscillospiraceae bacterium]